MGHLEKLTADDVNMILMQMNILHEIDEDSSHNNDDCLDSKSYIGSFQRASKVKQGFSMQEWIQKPASQSYSKYCDQRPHAHRGVSVIEEEAKEDQSELFEEKEPHRSSDFFD